MNRRYAIKNLSLITGGALLATSGLFQACRFSGKGRTAITDADVPLLDEIGETIIPATAASPGAKAAAIGIYMLMAVNELCGEKDKLEFISGLNELEADCRQQYKADFIELSQAQKKEFLTKLDMKAKMATDSKNASLSFINILKKLTIDGYTTSKVGVTQAFRYVPVPGKYEGCIAYKKGDKPWATN